MLGLELEGLSPQDREFEVARGIVRFAGAAAKQAAQASPGVSPEQAARKAVIGAAQKFAPGLIQSGSGQRVNRQRCSCQQRQPGSPGRGGTRRRPNYGGGGQQTIDTQPSGNGEQAGASGTWIRQNGQIILVGI